MQPGPTAHMFVAFCADTAYNVGDPGVALTAHVGAAPVQPAVQMNVTPLAPTTIGNPPLASTPYNAVPAGHTDDTDCNVHTDPLKKSTVQFAPTAHTAVADDADTALRSRGT